MGYSATRLLLCLDFSCSLLQARLPQCLSRQLAAASKGLMGQLPPEAAAVPQPMQGQQQHQQQRRVRDPQGKEEVPSPLPWPPSAALGGAPGRATAASRDAVSGPLRAAKHAVMITTTLMPCLYGFMSLAAGACCSASPFAAGSGSSSGPGPSHGSQPPSDAPGVKQLRQLSRRFLLLLAGGLRDSHLHDHWARAVLLAGLCRGPGERGEEEEGGEREEWTVRDRLLAMEEWARGVRDSSVGTSTEGETRAQAVGMADKHEQDQSEGGVSVQAVGGERKERTGRETPTQSTAAGIAGKGRGDRSEGGVFGKAGRAATVRAADAAGGSQQDPESQQQQITIHDDSDEVLLSTWVYSTGSVLLNLRDATKSDSHKLPPGLCTALQQALSGPCTQHLTLALGTLMLHQADGGSLYGMPLPYRTWGLGEALATATQDLAAGGSGAPPLKMLDMPIYGNFQRLLTTFGSRLPLPVPVVPPEGHLDLLLRLGQLAVRSAQAYRGQAGSMGPRMAVIGRWDNGDVGVTALQAARGLLTLRSGKAPAAVGPAAAVVGAGAEAGAGAAGGAVGAGGAGQGMEGAGAERAGADAAQAAAVLPGCPVGCRDAVAVAAARRAARAAVAAETRWHRLLLDTGMWVEMDGPKLAAWAEAWSHLESLGQLNEGTGAWGERVQVCVRGNVGQRTCLLELLGMLQQV